MSISNKDALEYLQSCSSDSVDLILTDPPYGTTKEKYDRPLTEDYKSKLVKELVRVCREDTGAMFIFLPVQEVGYWMSRLADIGMKHIRHGVWLKTNAMYNRQPYPSNALEYWVYCDKRTNPRYDRIVLPVYVCTNTQRLPEWETGNRHRFSKPISLLRTIILNHSHEFETVLDPFCGSGFTGVAALLENRKCLLNDFNSSFVKRAQRRLDSFLEYDGHKPLEDSVAKQEAAVENAVSNSGGKPKGNKLEFTAKQSRAMIDLIFVYSMADANTRLNQLTEDWYLDTLRGARGAKKGTKGYKGELPRNRSPESIWKETNRLVRMLNSMGIYDQEGKTKIKFISPQRTKRELEDLAVRDLIKRNRLKLVAKK